MHFDGEDDRDVVLSELDVCTTARAGARGHIFECLTRRSFCSA